MICWLAKATVFVLLLHILQDELNEEMAKQKIRLDRETSEKNEAFERIRELDGKVNSAATLVRRCCC